MGLTLVSSTSWSGRSAPDRQVAPDTRSYSPRAYRSAQQNGQKWPLPQPRAYVPVRTTDGAQFLVKISSESPCSSGSTTNSSCARQRW